MRTVVVGYLPTPAGDAALAAGVTEARIRQARLVVVSSHLGSRDLSAVEAREAREEVARVSALLERTGVQFDVRNMVRGFEPADDVISIAAAQDAELIVIGLRRRSPVGKLLLGSNAQRILLDAECPVLAVKAQH